MGFNIQFDEILRQKYQLNVLNLEMTFLSWLPRDKRYPKLIPTLGFYHSKTTHS